MVTGSGVGGGREGEMYDRTEKYGRKLLPPYIFPPPPRTLFRNPPEATQLPQRREECQLIGGNSFAPFGIQKSPRGHLSKNEDIHILTSSTHFTYSRPPSGSIDPVHHSFRTNRAITYALFTCHYPEWRNGMARDRAHIGCLNVLH